ncbi:MAG TPA: orotidine-5'-phosphate decarboxylase [Syntrophorhabdaceae bacterium]|nr:orotidine-5'-phosphate decarboxylase [Syntrophorhabdaceae bacterium]HOL04717.1 orotidine-5'-phosphate decarboxylase [Syntrophorhabdaceae bacterium]HON85270.1 orotidine-5'-phosphate decarboxylase [Syntrophorhabdaceae bacterium]HOT42591.1 orotidine-5'-phosphate decarboxylase [Syntrophorhabdaceae bacterium]HPC66151.1 orotidine-5'-phosphate decarboxylase [Syntrophorhabdaceae bacterium]
MDPKESIILALDVEHFEDARRLVMEYRDYVGMFKVGKQLFTHCGPKIVDFINMKDSKVFLDLKYHDIPNTVSKAVIEAAKLGVDMLNIHTAGGLTMMRESRSALTSITKKLQIPRPKIIGVTVLTSIDDNELKVMGIDITVKKLTKNLALLAKEAGLDGVVAGGEDIEMIRELCGDDFVIVTPGVRIGEKKDDQKRTITPKEAIEKGATYIVLGRTLLENQEPFLLLQSIYKDILNALSEKQR